MHPQYPPFRLATLGAILVIAAFLLFTRLGHYAFWDDEAVTALGAKGILLTGNTSVLMDHGNIVAYHNGEIISGFLDRVDPPLETYVTAVSFALCKPGTLAGRLPFALAGLGVFALVLLWVRRESWAVFLVVAIGFVTNVSLILYCRQCRYYALSIFFSVAFVYVYWRWKPSARNLLILAAISVLLFASNYLDYLALYACLAIDYFFWKRKEWPLTARNAMLLLGPQVILNGIIGYVWNPLRTQYGGSVWTSSLEDRLDLFFMYWRDMNACEFLAIPMLLLAFGIGVRLRHGWLVRGCVALLVYVAVITLISPQLIKPGVYANVRYVVAVIPLAIALEAGALCILFQRRAIFAIGAAILIFGTNLFNGGPLLAWGFQSTILCYAGELLHPPPEPYTPTAQWINEHVPEGSSIWVEPDYMTYPLMFYAPRALYAWQLSWPPRPDFAGLPPIHFMGQEPPDYLVAFGPSAGLMAQTIGKMNRPDIGYQRVATIDTCWRDMYRPELFLRTFTPVIGYDPRTLAIYIFQRTKPPIAAPAKVR